MPIYVWDATEYDDQRVVVIVAETLEEARASVRSVDFVDMDDTMFEAEIYNRESAKNHAEWMVLHEPDHVIEGAGVALGSFSKLTVNHQHRCAFCEAVGETLDRNMLPEGWVRRYYERTTQPGEIAVTVTGGLWPPGMPRIFDSEAHADAWEAEYPEYERIDDPYAS